jgi:pilus assembly protein CpaB
MQKRAIILLVLALIMGGIAVILVNSMLSREKGQREMQSMNTRPVVVAAVDLKTGTRLDALSIKTVDLPVDSLPEGVYGDTKTVLGEQPPVVLKEIRKNEVILPYKLSPQGARGGLPRRIPEDERAITISVNEITGVAGFVLPGDYVDVVFTTSAGRGDKQPVTHTLLQNLQVLGVDQFSSEDEDKPKVVNAITLLVNPNEGKVLTLAQQVGSLNLMLRNEFDASMVEDKQIAISDLLTERTERMTKTTVYKRERRPVVEVIRGLEIKKQTVKEGEPQTGTPSEEKK